MLTIGEKIRELRKTYCETQKELAKATGISVATISNIERNKYAVNSDYVYIFCEHFNVDANTLFGYT